MAFSDELRQINANKMSDEEIVSNLLSIMSNDIHEYFMRSCRLQAEKGYRSCSIKVAVDASSYNKLGFQRNIISWEVFGPYIASWDEFNSPVKKFIDNLYPREKYTSRKITRFLRQYAADLESLVQKLMRGDVFKSCSISINHNNIIIRADW